MQAKNGYCRVFAVLTVYNELQSERDEDNRVSRELIAERGNAAVQFMHAIVNLHFHYNVVLFVISVHHAIVQED